VLALTCDIELFTQAHYRASIKPDSGLCPLWRDVFLFHWREESQHAILDELEWQRIDATLTAAERDQGVTDLIELVAGVDGLLKMQAAADADYFVGAAGREFSPAQVGEIAATFLAAYRWQYIFSGVQEPRFTEILGNLVTADQGTRIAAALAGLAADDDSTIPERAAA
jgi:hypothetical protein